MYKDPNIQEELQSISSFWQTTNAIMPYQVPANYFEELLGKVRLEIEKEAVYHELELIAPLLNTIPKSNVYQKPTAKQKTPAKVLNITKWAVAAAFMGVVAAGAFLYNSKTQKVDYAAYINVDQTKILKNISDSTLLSYIDVHEKLIITPDISTATYSFENSESLIEHSSDQELLEYIETSN